MKVYRDLVENGVLVSKEIFDIAECTYTGKDMGERSITATIYFATPIDFQIGDYIKLPMQNLIRSTSGVNGSIASGSGEVEKFYIYTMPTMKKVARAMENGKAFEHTVTFYPAQYELSCVQMRDLGNSLSADEIIYTGFDSVSFNGGAKELMDRIMMVLKEAYHDSEGNPLWSYEISDSVNEEKNLALERFPISFSGNTVMDALLELNNKETINTTFFINNRKIYVGFKRPYFCRVTDGMSIDTNPSSQLFTFQYGKTSDKGVALQYGGLYDITKSVGKEVPITKLFAYGASRNLNRYYCSDRVKGGRYVNRLMLPSFDTDGKTDFIISEDALQRYGVREGTKQFEEIYPSIRYATYGDIRQVKYCIKVKASGVKDENIDSPSYPVARIQCYKIVEGEITGVNKLVEAAPPDDLAIYIHAMDKVVKVVLYGGATDAEAISKQRQHDTKVPTYTSGGSDYIPGACFIVHDRGFDEAGTVYENANRSAWFTSIDNLSGFTEKQKEEIKLNQINYTDTFWLTDLYIFQEYNQTYFSRDGYSAWSWARLNSKYTSSQGHIASDSVVVNEIVHVEPITLADTSMTAAGIDKPQSTFDIYLRDLGFTINEQNDFGEMVFILNGTVKVSILDGLLAGQEFEISGSINSTSPSCICAFNDDGTRNEAFFAEPDYTQDGANPQTPYDAFNKGAIWRVRLNRTNVDDPDYSNLNLAMPTKEINAKSGDHLVLLDLFMPDIYIHAAENRLLREARKYLEANDNGSISYAVNFDKVRMQQIPNYAMQLREGLNLRLVDEDLNIRTENNGRYIADYRTNPIYSQRELADGKNSDWVSTVAPIDFTRSKHYTIELSIFNSSEFDINDFKFALFKTKNDNNTSFEPEYSVEQTEKGMDIILTIKFQLPDNFDDGQLYYPSAYLCKLKSWYNIVDMYLISVFERDYAENEEVLNYADFTIDSLTVKITDNSGNNEPIREITATLSEQTNATAWATLMNRVATTAKEGEQNRKAIEEVVNTARRNYQALLSLKDSIFDPDGSCDQVFLQVMMQQVGADSMNYQLDNTRSGLSSDGQPILFNCSCERGSDGYYHFKVYNDDTLRHYVYTQGSQAGNWEIPVRATGFDVQLNGTESYFVCLKCPKNDTVGQWICSTKQYAVNDPEDDTCWFFNWAILTVDSGGVYALMETRGNAYMYGDNLVCGKISTLAGNSYFDLTHGDFVLGDGTGTALSYIDGILTISGSKGDAEETLRQLGILQGDVEAAAQAAEDAKNMEIGGRNLLTNSELKHNITGYSVARGTLTLVDGECARFTTNSDNSYHILYLTNSVTTTVTRITECDNLIFSFMMRCSNTTDNMYIQFAFRDANGTVKYLNTSYFNAKDSEWNKVEISPNGNMREWIKNNNLIPSTVSLYFVSNAENATIELYNLKLEKGNKATDWTPAPEDYMNAIAESEGNMTKALADSVAEINGGIGELQKQIDGEVSSYFYDTAPVGIDETILTNKEPFSEWAKNYTLSNGVYVLKENARNEFVNHIGDTYTNMEEYEEDSNGNTTTPLAGLAWRWCDATAVSPLPAKYITVSYKGSDGNNITKKLHWHKIADSDAVKALQEAGRAQSTADGKSTTFVVEPTNYNIGDLWILAADRTLNGTTYKKGTILTANKASATFDSIHWGEKVKYTDDTVAQQAVEAAANAKTAADNAQADATAAAQRLNDWATDGVISPVEKQGIKDEKARIDADKTQISNSCTQYGVSISSFETAYNNYANVLNSIIDATTEIVTIPSNFKTAQSEYYTQRTSVLDAISKKAQEVAEVYARQQAQQALDGLIVGGTNLIPAVGFSSSDSNQTITKLQEELYSQGVYQVTKITNATPPASSYNITRYVTAGKTYVASVYIRCDTTPSGTSLTKWGLIRFYGTNASGANVTYAESNIDAEPKVGQWYQRQVVYTIPSDFDASKETINIFCYAPSAAGVKSSMSCIKLEEGNKATPTYNMPISSIAQWAEESLQQLSDMSNDGILTPQEKKNVSNEWSEIQGMYSVNSNNVTSLFGSSKPTEWTEYNNNYSALEDYIETLNLGSGSNTTITKTVFQAKFSEYYNADVNLQKAIAKKSAELEVAAMEIGGRNLLLQTCLNQYIDKWSVWQSSKVLSNGWCKVTQNSGASSVGIITPKESDGAIIENGHSYILSFDCYLDTSALADSINANYCYLMFSSGGNYLIGNYATINKTPRRVSIPFTFSGNRTEKFGAMIGCQGTNIPAFYIKDIKLEKGTKATDWTPAPEDVDAAIEEAGYVNIYEGGDISKSYNATDNVKSQVLCSIYSGTYKTSAVENNGYGVNSTDPFHQSTLVVCKAGIGKGLQNVTDLYNKSSYILGTYYWGSDITVAEGADIVIFFAQKDYIDYCISTYEDFGANMPSGGSGTWTIRNIKIMTDNASAIKIAQSKAEALDYLKAALTDGSTEIAGGLTMTNVLMLKNLEGFVTAGLSGLTKYNNLEDKVLMWGGGTYEEAYAAANNDTYNTGNGTITTLLKKDGTGKIGIFKISETQAVVKTNQGEILIDATDDNGGVYVKDAEGQVKAAIVNGDVEKYQPLNDSTIISKTITINSDDYPNDVFEQGASGTCTTNRVVTFDLKQHMTAIKTTGYYTVKAAIYGRLTQGFTNTDYKNSSAYFQFDMDGASHSPISNDIYQNTLSYAQNGVSPGQYYMEVLRPIQQTSPLATLQKTNTYLTPGMDFNIKLTVSSNSQGTGWCLSKLTGNLSIVLTVVKHELYTPKTIVASNGIMSAYNNAKYFMVKNTSKTQKIYAKGLSQAKGTAGSGELYVTSDFINAFISLCNTLKTAFDDVRFEGNNGDHSTAISTALQDVIDELGVTSIIANS